MAKAIITSLCSKRKGKSVLTWAICPGPHEAVWSTWHGSQQRLQGLLKMEVPWHQLWAGSQAKGNDTLSWREHGIPECLALRYCTFTPAVKVKAPLPSVTLLQDRGHSETSLY